MSLSAKTEYACLAVLTLASHYGSGDPVRVRTIADLHGIPSPFLVQILLQLKGAGVVESTRGAAGGYRLVRDPEQLTMGEVVDLMEGGGGEVQSSASNRTPGVDAILEVWQEAVSAQRQMLANITFAQLVERSRGSAERMYYI